MAFIKATIVPIQFPDQKGAQTIYLEGIFFITFRERAKLVAFIPLRKFLSKSTRRVTLKGLATLRRLGWINCETLFPSD